MIQEGFESVYNAINTPFLENGALVGKGISQNAVNTPLGDRVLMMSTVLFLTIFSNFLQ